MYEKQSSGYKCKEKTFDIVMFLICPLCMCIHYFLSLEVIHKPLLFFTVLSIGLWKSRPMSLWVSRRCSYTGMQPGYHYSTI